MHVFHTRSSCVHTCLVVVHCPASCYVLYAGQCVESAVYLPSLLMGMLRRGIDAVRIYIMSLGFRALGRAEGPKP